MRQFQTPNSVTCEGGSYPLDSWFVYFSTSLSTYPWLILGSHFQVMWLTHRDNVKFRKEHSPKISLTEVSQSCWEEMASGFWQWILGSWKEGDDSEKEESWAGRWWKPWVKEGTECCLQLHFIPHPPALPWKWQQISWEGRTWLQCNKMAKGSFQNGLVSHLVGTSALKHH